MAKTPRGGGGSGPAKTRAIGAAAATASGPGVQTPPVSRTASSDRPKKAISAGQFAREVRAEGRKITWPSRKETWITSLMVFIMVVISAIFFAIVDGSLSFLLQQTLRLVSQ